MREMQTGKELSVNEHSCLMAYKACFYRLSRMTTSSGLIPAMKKGPAGPLSLMCPVLNMVYTFPPNQWRTRWDKV